MRMETCIACDSLSDSYYLFLTCFCNIFYIVSDGLDLRPKYNGILHCMKSVWKQEGLRGLYQGVAPNIWGAGASWGLYFLLYVSCEAVWINIYVQWFNILNELVLSSFPATMQSKVTLKRVVRPSWVPLSTWCLRLKQVSFIPTLLSQLATVNSNQITLLWANCCGLEAD